MEQKKFMDIVRLKEFDVELEDGTIIPSNCKGFEVGDIIQISEKWDGSNASIRYNFETNKLEAFSRRLLLTYENTLNGFFNYVQTLNASEYSNVPNYVIFGEWGVKNCITYRDECMKKWYVYDIYDVESQQYLPQSFVKEFCKEHNLIYIHIFYEGEFISWEHAKTFLNSSAYGDTQEGIVIKNQTKLNNSNRRIPFVLKIVNESFKEIKKDNHIRKVEDPQKLKEKEKAQNIVDQIVTKQRVKKQLLKMRDEGLLPNELCEKDMRIIAQNLPKRIVDDCVKEEPQLVQQAGKFFGKISNQTTMRFARELVLGE